ncbi:MAG TPA: ABC transporter ATP-binding protein, partial [Candidatus Limnocylindrales bacterium]|nr:ABC transporter ATP-binding protein [Candidatus Limnocylindrales bacterium]
HRRRLPGSMTTEPAVRPPLRRSGAAPDRRVLPAKLEATRDPVTDMAATTLERMPPILAAHNLAKRYRLGASTVDALQGVSLAVEEGEFVALMGPSGSGKSTLLQLLGGLDRPTAGEVVLQGEVVSALDDDAATKLRRDRTGFVFQSFNLIPLLDVAENVMLPFTISGTDRSQEIRDRVADAIALVDLAGKEHHKPDQLSAGEQQRVAIARALVTRPALLFADEPTGNLDYTTGTEILEALWRSCVERRQTIVLVTHDSKAAAYADRVLVISDGRIRDEIVLGRRRDHDTGPLVGRLAELGL